MEKRMKREFMNISVPDMTQEIMDRIRHPNERTSLRKIKPAVIIAAVVILLAVGAAAGGIRNMVELKKGGKYLIVNDEGIAVNPTGFHFEDADVNFSEKAIDNIAQYITTPPEPANLYEAHSISEMERFLDMKLYLPKAVAENAALYRLWSVGSDGEAVSVHLQITAKNKEEWEMEIYLRGSPGVIGTASEPVIYGIDISAELSASVAVAESRKGGMTAYAIYEIDGAVYDLVVKGNNTNEVLEKAELILSTIEG